MIENGILHRLTQKRKHRGLTEPEQCIYEDLIERGEPDLNIYYPEDKMSEWLTKMYVKFIKDVTGIDLFHTQINFAGRVIHTLIHILGEHVTALFSRQCVVGDTLVLNQNGRFIPIEDMVEGEFKDCVGVDEEYMQVFPGSVTKYHRNGKQKIFRVTTKSGFEIFCTEGHRFFVKHRKIRNVITGKWERLKNLRKGRYIAVYRNAPVFGEHRESTHKLLALAYFYGVSPSYLQENDSVDVISQSRISEIENTLERFGDELEKSSLAVGKLKTDSNCLKWVASQYNLGKLPEWVESLEKEQLRKFLSRFWAHRMTVLKCPKKTCCGNETADEHTRLLYIDGEKKDHEFLYQMKLLLLKFGVKSELFKNNGGYRLRINRYEVPRFMYEIQPYRVRNMKIPDKVSVFRKDCEWEKITMIEELAPEDTYDMTVEVTATKRWPSPDWKNRKVKTKKYHNVFENGFVCHNSGKTENVARLQFFLSVFLPMLAKQKGGIFDWWKDGYWCGIYAPILDQSQNAFRRLRSVMTDERLAVFGLEKEVNRGNTIETTGGSKVESHTASDSSQIESRSWHTVVLEEAQDIGERQIVKSIIPMLSFYNGSPIFVGSPTDHAGIFYNEIQDNKQNSPKNHLEYDYRHVCYVHEPYYRFVLKQVSKYGWDDDYIKMSYRLIWVLAHGHFVTAEDFSNCARFDLEAGRLLKTPYPKYIGIDVAKDPAQTVGTCTAVINDDRVVIDWIALGGEDYIPQSQFLGAWIGGMNNVRAIYVDSTSKDGDSMTELLINQLPNKRIVPIKYTPYTKDAMYRSLSLGIKGENGRPSWWYAAGTKTQRTREFRDFQRQFGDLRKSYRGGLMVCEKPNQKGSADDYCDSSAMSNYASYQETTTVLTSSNKKPSKDGKGVRKFAERQFSDKRFSDKRRFR